MKALRLTTYSRGSTIPPLPGSMTFHSTELFHIYETTPGYSPLLIVASRGERVVGKLLGVIRRSERLFPPSLIQRCEVYGDGEYFLSDADDVVSDINGYSSTLSTARETIFEEMLSRLTSEALRGCFLIEFRNLENPLFGFSAFKRAGYFAISWMRVYNSLHSVTHVEERFSPSRLRQIKRGLKHGAKVHATQELAEIQAFGKMLLRNYSWKIRRHFPSPVFFEQLIHHLSHNNHCRIFLVTYRDRIIGGSVCIYSNTRAYLWFSGGLRKSYAQQAPGMIAVWAAMTDAKARGYEHLEFLDVGLPFQQHGYRDFVLRFGGKQVSSRRWFRFRWSWLNRLLCKLYE